MIKKTNKRRSAGRKKICYACKACGLVVTVDNTAGYVTRCDIICCNKKMTQKR